MGMSGRPASAPVHAGPTVEPVADTDIEVIPYAFALILGAADGELVPRGD